MRLSEWQPAPTTFETPRRGHPLRRDRDRGPHCGDLFVALEPVALCKSHPKGPGTFVLPAIQNAALAIGSAIPADQGGFASLRR